METISCRRIILYCLPLFAAGLFTTMLNNYLICFCQPTASGLPVRITQEYVFAGMPAAVGLIKAIGHVADAVSDPMVATLSGKSGHRAGCTAVHRYLPLRAAFHAHLAVLPAVGRRPPGE